MAKPEELRQRMVEQQIAARGVRDPRVLGAMRSVPREAFVPADLVEFAHDDAPLPIEEGQTISQPYVVAWMAEALMLEEGDRVLEVGTGSGYAAAVLSRLAGEVWTIERHAELVQTAAARIMRLGYENVHVISGDGTQGWPAAAPFDAIVVAAGGPRVPRSLREQLTVGGRLVIPVGETLRLQSLLRITRTGQDAWHEEDLGPVAFVPLVGREGWGESAERNPGLAERSRRTARPARRPAQPKTTQEAVAAVAEPFGELDSADLTGLLERIGSARVVLLGEATHGTSEFYRFRARLTRELVTRKGFNVVAVEADWPDAARIDHYVRDLDVPPSEWTAFTRFPTWMWRNREVVELVEWLRDYNVGLHDHKRRVGFHGLDLYSLYTSIDVVLRYLDDVDPDAAEVARARYGCLTPYERDPATYGRAALRSRYASCEDEVALMLSDLLSRRLDYTVKDGERFLDATQNARLVQSAEQYYRAIYRGARESWNLRDSHMFETLLSLLEHRGPGSRAVVWAHNSHLGDASATEMGAQGEHNVGQLCRQHFGDGAWLLGFGTDRGTVAAASAWDEPMQVMNVRPSHPESIERVCHETGIERFLLPLRYNREDEVTGRLSRSHLERAIGVVYRPESELASHYFQVVLPRQFDEYVWFDVTRAVTPLDTREVPGMPETWPFGL